MRAAVHPRQEARLAALRRYAILDTPRERDFDEIADLASQICETPIAVINLIDAERQWFKAEIGLGVRETPLETSLCSHVILENDFVEIPDTHADPRMRDNPLCLDDDGLRFYAGALLVSSEGLPIGTLCVLDRRPRVLAPDQRKALMALARQVMRQLDLRAVIASAQMLRNEIDHRVKNSLSAVGAFVALERRGSVDPEAQAVLDRVAQQINTVALLHDQLSHNGADQIDLAPYLSRVTVLAGGAHPAGAKISGRFDSLFVLARDAALLGTVVNELAANAIKHGQASGGAEIVLTGEALGDGRYRLVCANAGAAVPITKAESPREGLGLKIIAATVRQLSGTIATEQGEAGYRTTIEVSPQVD